MICIAIAASYVDNSTLFFFFNGFFISKGSGTLEGLQTASNIQQCTGQLGKIDRGSNKNIVAFLNVLIDFLHVVIDAAPAVFPTISTVHARLNTTVIRIDNLIFTFQVFQHFLF